MIKRFFKKIFDFLESHKSYPILTGIATGLYPLLHYYNSNFIMVNTWNQLFDFVCFYILLPVVIILLVYKTLLKGKSYELKKRTLTYLNLAFFGFFVAVTLFGFKTTSILIFVGVSLMLATLVKGSLHKVIAIQIVLALFTLVKLIPDFYKHISYSSAWLEQPDFIEDVIFKTKPNVYVIQPDGYANFSELKKGYYNYKNDELESFLISNKFKIYYDFRSNYNLTLNSNTSLFAMKHHYYSDNKKSKTEMYKTREVIVGKNPVITTFKNNGYKTFLLLEEPYLLLNKPEIAYDYCNYDLDEIPFLSRGFGMQKSLLRTLDDWMKTHTASNNFFFIEKIKPGHISSVYNISLGKEKERIRYIKRLNEANLWLQSIIKTIEDKDKNALIIVAADHGGYVGLNYTDESRIKTSDMDLVRSMFSNIMAIKWPNKDLAREFDKNLKTNVNLFRVLFSYLGADKTLLNNLQEDSSFMVIDKGAPSGVYELIDKNGNVVFKKNVKTAPDN